MKLYADQPVRRLGQVLLDLLVLGWVVLWVRVGQGVHEIVGRLAAPGRTLEQAGTSLTAGLTSVGEAMADVPLVGDDLRAPFDATSLAAGEITDAGVGLQEGVATTAVVIAVAIAAWPILVGVVWWGRRRLAFSREATAVRRLVRGGADLDLFALRALTRQSLPVLSRIGPDPAGDWRRGDEATVRALARLELDDAGVALPQRA
jgi:hypothetical protein